MKNIHVLPTNQKSKIFFNHNKGFEKYQFSKEPFVNGLTNTSNQNIYITNSEEIKEGDWCISLCDDESYEEIYQCKDVSLVDEEDKKIILTTDQDLIKDGVQAIDDEFLEWFVKNPSCEFVKVEQEMFKLVHNPNYVNYTPDKDGIYLLLKDEKLQQGETLIEDNIIDYKIIIPQEEPKQETLEEAAENYAKQFDYAEDSSPQIDFIEGAKWQAERMYSKVIEFAEWIRNNPYVWNYPDKLSDTRTTEELFEQFKKK